MKTRRRSTAMRPISEEPIVFGRVVAEREYRIGRAKLVLQIGTPHQASWKSAFYCPIRLVRAGKPTLNRVFGVDSVQALMLAFDLAKVLLETTSPKIKWEAGERSGDVGIYRRLTTGLGMDFDKGIERMVDKAILKRTRELERVRARSERGAKP